MYFYVLALVATSRGEKRHVMIKTPPRGTVTIKLLMEFLVLVGARDVLSGSQEILTDHLATAPGAG